MGHQSENVEKSADQQIERNAMLGATVGRENDVVPAAQIGSAKIEMLNFFYKKKIQDRTTDNNGVTIIRVRGFKP